MCQPGATSQLWERQVCHCVKHVNLQPPSIEKGLMLKGTVYFTKHPDDIDI